MLRRQSTLLCAALRPPPALVERLQRSSFAAARLKSLAELADPAAHDRSIAGGVDAGVRALVDCINSKSTMFTTSSCSGRVSVFHRIPDDGASKQKRGAGRGFLYVSHSPITGGDAEFAAVAGTIYASLFEAAETESAPPRVVDGMVQLKFEPVILHAKCVDLATAQALVQAAAACALRSSGISAPPTSWSLSTKDRDEWFQDEERKQQQQLSASSERRLNKRDFPTFIDGREFHVSISASNASLNSLLVLNRQLLMQPCPSVIESLLRHCTQELFPANERKKEQLRALIEAIP